jgi:ribosomal protein S15P/S13E
MQARVVNGKELTSHIGQRHRLARYLKLVNRARWNIGSFGSALKRHIHSLLGE